MVFRFITIALLAKATVFQTSANDINPSNNPAFLLPEDSEPEHSKNVKSSPSTFQRNTLPNAEASRDAKEEPQIDGKNKNKWKSHHQTFEKSDEYMTSDATSAELKEQENQPPDDYHEHCYDETDDNSGYDGIELIEWIVSNGGFIHPNVRIGKDPSGEYRGIFVKEWDAKKSTDGVGIGKSGRGIGKDEVISEIPWNLIIKPMNYHFERFWSCDAVNELYSQFLLRDKSPFAPYVKYLLNQPKGRIPSEWTLEGKQLLRFVLGQGVIEDSIALDLQPRIFNEGYERIWLDECKGEDNPMARAAYYQLTTRDEDTLMVPFYDMCNHSNDPKKLNTISTKPRHKGESFFLRAIRDIEQNEQIYNSYNRCNRCWFDPAFKDCTTWSHYGTNEVFGIFGFVEEFPQTWGFPVTFKEKDDKRLWYSEELSFCLDIDDDETLLVSFEHDDDPTDQALEYLKKNLARLEALGISIKGNETLKEGLPCYEWNMIWKYHESLMSAISAAVAVSGPDETLFEYGSNESEYSRGGHNNVNYGQHGNDNDEKGNSIYVADSEL
mmetsp:Transcript_18599/g.39007  ORF Transcript_18599/g.39007 Transcript_18599/m.39007 type:complete len:552 (+) Transcript_18599:217-1872(+)